MAARLRGRPLAAVVPIGIGHNNGPPMATRWGLHCWKRAQAAAWKAPAPEVVKLRLRRAAELGLSYRRLAAILMEAGRAPSVLVFGLDGLIAAGGGARLRALVRPTVLLIAADATGAAEDRIRRARDEAGGRVDGWRIAEAPAGLAEALRALLADHAVPPSATLVIAASGAEWDAAVRVRVAAILDASAYFEPPAEPQPTGHAR